MTSEIPEVPGLADLSPLGRGGLADVYLARQGHLERWVAAKVFRVTLADEQAAERFRAECRAIGRLDQYPHVLTVYDAGVLADGRPYLISERCDGSLSDLVAMRGPLPADRVAALGSTIARALRFAHSAGVLHGDVTPQNLLLRTSGAPVLADFGLAVLRDHAPTAAGFTLVHAAPEALRAGTVIDERADVYGLGSTLYTVLTGAPPFPPEPDEDAAAYRARVSEQPPPRPDGAPDQLAGLLVAMLAADPEHRPSTDEVIAALQVAPSRGTLAATRPETDLTFEPTAAPVPEQARPVRVGHRWVGDAHPDDALLPVPSGEVRAPRAPWRSRSTAGARSRTSTALLTARPSTGAGQVRDVAPAIPRPPEPRSAPALDTTATAGPVRVTAGSRSIAQTSRPGPPVSPSIPTGSDTADPAHRSVPAETDAEPPEPPAGCPTSGTAAGPAWSSGQDDLLPDLGPVAEPVRIPGRPRRRGHRRVLLAAGSASAVLITGAGGAAWHLTDGGTSLRPPGPTGPGTPAAAPGEPAPARALPADLALDADGPVTGEALAEGAFPGITRPQPVTPQRSATPRAPQPSPVLPQRAPVTARPPVTAAAPRGRAARPAAPEGASGDDGPTPRDRPVAQVRPSPEQSRASTPVDPPGARAR